MTELELYYNKFNEEKRLNSRHGQVEFRVSMKYIEEMLSKMRDTADGRKLEKEEIKIYTQKVEKADIVLIML